jgi:hypothetical protein
MWNTETHAASLNRALATIFHWLKSQGKCYQQRNTQYMYLIQGSLLILKNEEWGWKSSGRAVFYPQY